MHEKKSNNVELGTQFKYFNVRINNLKTIKLNHYNQNNILNFLQRSFDSMDSIIRILLIMHLLL